MNAPARKVPRSIHEGARNMARDIARSNAGRTSRKQRKKVEMLFAHLKRILCLDRLRLRGPNGARDEFHLAATAQNLASSPSSCQWRSRCRPERQRKARNRGFKRGVAQIRTEFFNRIDPKRTSRRRPPVFLMSRVGIIVRTCRSPDLRRARRVLSRYHSPMVYPL
jgi:Transposase DDE domain